MVVGIVIWRSVHADPDLSSRRSAAIGPICWNRRTIRRNGRESACATAPCQDRGRERHFRFHRREPARFSLHHRKRPTRQIVLAKSLTMVAWTPSAKGSRIRHSIPFHSFLMAHAENSSNRRLGGAFDHPHRLGRKKRPHRPREPRDRRLERPRRCQPAEAYRGTPSPQHRQRGHAVGAQAWLALARRAPLF